MSIERIPDLDTRARLHAALSDPTRLAIVDALFFGDASPTELQRIVEVPSNLLAHHLKVLASAGLIMRGQSEADRRRSYLRLNHAALEPIQVAVQLRAPRIVFVCTANSARSQLAAALWRRVSAVPVASAGTHPAARIEPAALAAARRNNLKMRASRPKALPDVAIDTDLVVTVCDLAHEELGERATLHWSIPDPVRLGTDAAFDGALTALTERVGGLASALLAG